MNQCLIGVVGDSLAHCTITQAPFGDFVIRFMHLMAFVKYCTSPPRNLSFYVFCWPNTLCYPTLIQFVSVHLWKAIFLDLLPFKFVLFILGWVVCFYLFLFSYFQYELQFHPFSYKQLTRMLGKPCLNKLMRFMSVGWCFLSIGECCSVVCCCCLVLVVLSLILYSSILSAISFYLKKKTSFLSMNVHSQHLRIQCMHISIN